MLPLLQWPKKERAAERSASPRDVLMKDDPDEQQRVRGLEEVMLPSPPKASTKRAFAFHTKERLNME